MPTILLLNSTLRRQRAGRLGRGHAIQANQAGRRGNGSTAVPKQTSARRGQATVGGLAWVGAISRESGAGGPGSRAGGGNSRSHHPWAVRLNYPLRSNCAAARRRRTNVDKTPALRQIVVDSSHARLLGGQ